MVPSINFFLHDLLNPEVSTATEVVPAPMASPGLSQGQASAVLYDPFMPSKPVPHERLLNMTKFIHKHEVQPWPICTPASVC